MAGWKWCPATGFLGLGRRSVSAPDRKHFVGVLDTGHWLTGSIERDQQGRLSGLSGVEITPMKNGSGATFEGKGRMDAEGLALKGDQVLVSFEQDHRVEAYPDPGFETSSSVGSIPILVPIRSLRSGRGFETLAVAPPESALKGAAVIISEESRDRKGNIYGAILSGPLKGRFAVTRDGDFDPTDGAFLPDGDLLLLERRFNIANGIAMRIRRIAASRDPAGRRRRWRHFVDGRFRLPDRQHGRPGQFSGARWQHACDHRFR